MIYVGRMAICNRVARTVYSMIVTSTKTLGCLRPDRMACQLVRVSLKGNIASTRPVSYIVAYKDRGQSPSRSSPLLPPPNH